MSTAVEHQAHNLEDHDLNSTKLFVYYTADKPQLQI